MQAEHVVITTHIVHEGQRHSASYFVEAGTIHANIEGRTLVLPLGRMPAEETVKAVLRGILSRRNGQADRLQDLIS